MGAVLAGRKLKNQSEVFVAAAAYSASFQTTASGLCAQWDAAILVANCTAVAGGGTAAVKYQISLDGGTTWADVASMASITGAGVTILRISPPIGSLFRLDVAITGTSVTFEVRIDFSLTG